jgi:mono/diheme cytochrome c family protein
MPAMKIKNAFLRAEESMLLVVAHFFALGVFPASARQASDSSPADRKWNYAELTKVPEKARDKRNPFESDPESVQAGGKLFEMHYAECHGMKAEGGKRGPSLLHEKVQQATSGTLFWTLSNGVVRHGMPDWSKLPEPQRWQIISFLKSFKIPAGTQSSGNLE